MTTYSEYKDSGIAWIGRIPSHWRIASLRQVLESFSDKGHAEAQLLSVTRERGVVTRGEKGEDDNNNVIPEDLSGYKHIVPGDFVINKMKSWQGSYGLSDFNGIVSPAYFTYHLHFKNRRFFSIALRSKAYVPFFMQYSKGIRVDQWDLKPDAIKAIPFIMPSEEEQEAIVEYLDKATAEIDKAIDAKERIIAALEERRIIIITEAVTRGINPNAPLRDSGIEWLGLIPAHWGIERLRFLCSTKTGDKDTIMRVDDGLYPFYVRSPKIERINNYTFDTEAILMSGDGAGAGRIFHYVKGKFGCHQRVYCLHNFPKRIFPQFLHFYMQTKFKEVFLGLSAKSTVDSVRLPMLKNFEIVLPPIEEQKDIFAYMQNQLSSIETAINQLKRLIELLRERKNIIINEAVTGKVKVI